ncbi:hypothetical protein PSHT_00963, partial [Puccinia striiformis]
SIAKDNRVSLEAQLAGRSLHHYQVRRGSSLLVACPSQDLRSRSKPYLKWMPLVTGFAHCVQAGETSRVLLRVTSKTVSSGSPPFQSSRHPSPSGGLLKRTPQSPYTREPGERIRQGKFIDCRFFFDTRMMVIPCHARIVLLRHRSCRYTNKNIAPVTITEREDATVVNVTLRDNPIFETNKANTILGSQNSIGVNSTTVVTATTTINTNPTTQVGVSHQIGFDTEGRKMLNLTALY